jgi:S-adenosylmethionine uptake transporter
MNIASNHVQAAIIATLAFGIFTIADAMIKLLSERFAVFQIAAMIMATSLVMLVAYAFAIGRHPDIMPKYPRLAFLRAALLTVNSLLFFYAFSQLPMTDVYVVGFTNPIMVSILAFLFLKERLSPVTVLAILLGFAGVLVALQPGSAQIGVGHVAAFVAIVLFSLSILLLRVARPDESGLALTAAVFLLLAAVASTLQIFWGGFAAINIEDAAYVGIGALCTVVANVLLVKAFRMGNAGSVAPFQYTQLVWGSLLGWLLFSDGVDLQTLIGALIIIVSGWIVVRQGRAVRAPA